MAEGWLSRAGRACGHGPAIIFAAVLGASLFGIWSRPVGFLASIWPANAIALGLLLRLPGAARPIGWGAAAAAFLLADLLTGAAPLKAAVLNLANLLSIAAAYAVLSRLPADLLQLRQPVSMLWIVVAAALGGIAAGGLGGLANPLFFGGSIFSGFLFWWVTEVVNYVALLPVLLSAPSAAVLGARLRAGIRPRRGDLLPAAAVILSCALALTIGGPGAVALPVLALLWCGLVYPVFATTLLTLAFGLLALVFISQGYMPDVSAPRNETLLFSFRLGAAAIAIAPIMLSIVTRTRNDLMAQLHQQATRDALTGIRNRAAFRQETGALLDRRGAVALLMIDLDRFKAVNDTYGHTAGDEVLCEAVRRLTAALRPGDLAGRLGGEEFAAALRDCTPDQAQLAAERIRAAIAAGPMRLATGQRLDVTASIGLAFSPAGEAAGLDSLLERADRALYAAKAQGRDRVVSAA